MFGDLDCALNHLTIALIIKPARTSTWVPMAETLANLGQVDKAAAAYALAYHFSSNQAKTRTFFETAMLKQDQDPRVIAAIRAALQSPLTGGSGGAIAMGGGIPTPPPPPPVGQVSNVPDEGEDYTVFARSQTPAPTAMPSAIPSAPQQPPGMGPLNVLPTTIGPAVSGTAPSAVPSPQPSPQGPLAVLPSSVSVPAQPQVSSAAPVSGTPPGTLPALQVLPPGSAGPAAPMQTAPQVIAQPSPQPAAPVSPQPTAAVGQPPVVVPSALPAGASIPAAQMQTAPQVIAQPSPQPTVPVSPQPTAAVGQPPVVVSATPNSASDQVQVAEAQIQSPTSKSSIQLTSELAIPNNPSSPLAAERISVSSNNNFPESLAKPIAYPEPTQTTFSNASPGDICFWTEQEMFRRYHALGENYIRIVQRIEHSNKQILKWRQDLRQTSDSCPQSFIEGNLQEIEQIKSLPISEWLDESLKLNACAGLMIKRIEKELNQETRPLISQRLVREADRARNLESDLTDIARDLAYLRNKAARLIEGLQENLDACGR